MNESYVSVGKGHTTFVGRDATNMFAARVLKSAIDLYIETGFKANRAYTSTAMRAAATRITGKTYKRTELAKASADLKTWVDAMKSAMPVETSPKCLNPKAREAGWKVAFCKCPACVT